MTTTMLSRSTFDRARPECTALASPVTSHARAKAHAIAPATTAVPDTRATATTADMNLWLGGCERDSGFDPKYATKQISPGRLGGTT